MIATMPLSIAPWVRLLIFVFKFDFLAAVEQTVKFDEYLSVHYRFYVREMRIKAYVQLLDSYRSLTVDAMAKAFGVSQEFIDV
jgi:26S proteasome regulatory subunit N7